MIREWEHSPAVIALHLSTRLAWAIARPGLPVESGVESLAKSEHGEEPELHRLLRFSRWLGDLAFFCSTSAGSLTGGPGTPRPTGCGG
jgi:hypothetical protein